MGIRRVDELKDGDTFIYNGDVYRYVLADMEEDRYGKLYFTKIFFQLNDEFHPLEEPHVEAFQPDTEVQMVKLTFVPI